MWIMILEVFFSVKSLLWNEQFYLDFFVCGFASTIFGNTDLQDLHVLLFWAKDFKTKNLSCIKNSRIREFGMFVPNSAPTQWNAVKRGVFCLDVLSQVELIDEIVEGFRWLCEDECKKEFLPRAFELRYYILDVAPSQ